MTASASRNISILPRMEDWAFSSCEPWQMGLTQNFNLNMTVLVFALASLNQNIWPRKELSGRPFCR